MFRVMVLSGTKDAREIIRELQKVNAAVTATVTTSYGKELLEVCPGIDIYQGKLDAGGMEKLIREEGIGCVVDASHPFAREASENAIMASRETGTPYLRFERESTEIERGDIIRVNSFEDAAEIAVGLTGNILLTIGSNHVKVFTDRIKDFKKRLFVRILPDSRMLAKCEDMGLGAGNILAVKGPFSEEMNTEMLKHCNAKVLVTKESGDAGGTREKLQAAINLGIKVILVERPEVEYTEKVSSIGEVVEFVLRQQKGWKA